MKLFLFEIVVTVIFLTDIFLLSLKMRVIYIIITTTNNNFITFSTSTTTATTTTIIVIVITKSASFEFHISRCVYMLFSHPSQNNNVKIIITIFGLFCYYFSTAFYFCDNSNHHSMHDF